MHHGVEEELKRKERFLNYLIENERVIDLNAKRNIKEVKNDSANTRKKEETERKREKERDNKEKGKEID
jgi:hypothetical protein